MPRIILLAFLIVVLSAVPALAEKPLVLVINSYHATHPWVVSHNGALMEKLGDEVEFVIFDMDTKRRPESEHSGRADQAYDLYRKLQPDVVVLTDDNALMYLGKKIASGGTPVVYLGINNNPRSYFGGMPMSTGVLERPLFKRSIVFLKDIMVNRFQKCLVLFDDGATARFVFERVFGGDATLEFAQTSISVCLIGNWERWKETVVSAGYEGYDAIILGLYHTIVDEGGVHVPDETVARWTSANSPVPVFAFWDFAVGKGKAVGGLVLAGRSQGEAAAKLVRRILDGESSVSIPPVEAEHGRFVFSDYELERWRLEVPTQFASPSESIEYVE